MPRIFSLNCNGLKSKDRVFYLRERLRQYKVDVCFLQETHVDNAFLGNSIEKILEGKIFWSFTNNSGKGVGIFISKDFPCEVQNFRFDTFGRYIYVDISFEGNEFRLVNIYAPNIPRERKDFFEDLYGLVLCARPVILGGDFNCVGNLRKDKRGGNPERGREGWDELNSIIKDFDLIDCFRSKYPDREEYTWRGRDVACRLDRFYVSSAIITSIKDIRHIMYGNSDHCFISLELSTFSHVKMGKPYWKFNSSLISDLDYVDYMSIYLKRQVDCCPDNNEIIDWWDRLKERVKLQTIWFSQCKIKRRNQELNDLRREYYKLDNQGLWAEAKIMKENILNIEMNRLKGSQLRSKIRNVEEGEKPTRFFLRQELKRGKKKTIRRVVDLKGHNCSSSEDIARAFREFYQALFADEGVEEEVVIDLLTDTLKVSEEEKEGLEGDIRSEEILCALKAMDTDKSPGSDGLTKEFFSCFVDILLPVLVKLFKAIHANGSLSESQKMSYISLLCKDENNSELLKNYRPISLMNLDYKIITKVLCNRLKHVMSSLVHPDQTCAVPGFSIVDGCHTVRDVIDYMNDRNEEAVLLSLDQEKAFDRVSHYYLINVLKAAGLGEDFVNWIKTIYNDIYCSLIVNHFVTEPISVQRSVRQGCSLSPLLYVLCMEPIFNKIRTDREVVGVKAPGRVGDQKVAAFADDSNFFLKNERSVQKVTKWYDYFGRGSGAKLNKNKSKGMFLGKWRNRSDHPFGISWVKKIKVFGVWYGDVTPEDIWEPVLTKIRNTLNLFKGRVMSMYGRATIVNVMVGIWQQYLTFLISTSGP